MGAFNLLMTQSYTLEYNVCKQHITTIYQIVLGLMQQICRGADLSFCSEQQRRRIIWKAYDGTTFSYNLECNTVPRELAIVQVSV